MLSERIVVTQYGGPEKLAVVKEALREPSEGELRIKVQCAGVALADIMRREGVYPGSPQPPFTPGYDAVGIVDEIGKGIEQYSIGDQVGVFYKGIGGYAAYGYVMAKEVFRVPASVDPAQAVAIILNYVTAYQMLYRFAKIAVGDKILVHGAGGGVGTALLELARLAKVTVIGTASLAKHTIVMDYGATPIDYKNEDFVAAVQRLAPDGVDAVFDPIGGDNWSRSFQTLGHNGRFVGYGYTSILGQDNSEVWMKDWSALSGAQRTESGHEAHLYSITTVRKEQPDWFLEDIAVLFSMLEKGEIKPLVSHRVPLREAAHAQLLLEQSLAVGKVVLMCS